MELEFRLIRKIFGQKNLECQADDPIGRNNIFFKKGLLGGTFIKKVSVPDSKMTNTSISSPVGTLIFVPPPKKKI